MSTLKDKKMILDSLMTDTPLKRIQEKIEIAPWVRFVDKTGPRRLVVMRERDSGRPAEYAIAAPDNTVGKRFTALSDREAIVKFREMIRRPETR